MNDVLMFIVLQGGSQNIKYVDNSDISRYLYKLFKNWSTHFQWCDFKNKNHV
jgi:hypothetical protein